MRPVAEISCQVSDARPASNRVQGGDGRNMKVANVQTGGSETTRSTNRAHRMLPDGLTAGNMLSIQTQDL